MTTLTNPAYAGPPYVILAMIPGNSLCKSETDKMCTPSKLFLDGVYGVNFKEMSKKDIQVFDPTFNNDVNFIYRFMSKWPNLVPIHLYSGYAVENKARGHHGYLMEKKCTDHAYELNMHQTEYLETSVKLFERVENPVQDVLMSSLGHSFGFYGPMLVRVEELITKLECRKMYPHIRARYERISPGGSYSNGNYQVLKGIWLFMDADYRCIRIPDNPESTKMGYNPGEPVFLL